jgi:hypothetical protein
LRPIRSEVRPRIDQLAGGEDRDQQGRFERARTEPLSVDGEQREDQREREDVDEDDEEDRE